MSDRLKNALLKGFLRYGKPLLYRHNLSARRGRRGMRFFSLFLPCPRNLAHYEPFTLGSMRTEWITPKRGDNGTVFLYLHGGGYQVGGIRTHRALATRIALATGCRLWLVDYRMAPEHPFPCALEDAVAAYRFLLHSGYAPTAIVIGGDSAGGGLTLATLLRLRQMGIQMPAAAVCLSPWIDLTASDPQMPAKQKEDPFIDIQSLQYWGESYAGEQVRNPLASPRFAELKGLCPLLVQVGTAEILHCDALALKQICERDGVPIVYQEYPEMLHVFQAFGGLLQTADDAIERIGKFTREHLQAAP